MGWFHDDHANWPEVFRLLPTGNSGRSPATFDPVRERVSIPLLSNLVGLPAGPLVIADKGYDADALVQAIQVNGAQAVIPPLSNRRDPQLDVNRP